MALNLEQSSGLTANFGNPVFANSGGANAQVSTTNATVYAINGQTYAGAIKASAVYTNLNDIQTGAAPTAIVGGKAAVVVTCFDTAGALRFAQGPIVDYTLTNPVAGQAILQMPSIPAGFCPIAYQVIKNKNTAGTAGWTYGASNFNASNLSFETAVQVCQLPNLAVANASA